MKHITRADIREWYVIAAAIQREKDGYTPSEPPTPVERFVYEYDDADPVRSEAFLDRLVEMVNAHVDSVHVLCTE